MKDAQYIYRARCSKVISGDTIDALIDVGFNIWVRKRVRLFNITAPAMNSRDADVRRAATISKQRLRDLIYNELFIVESCQLAKHETSMAVIYCHGHNINQQMIEEGHATKRDAPK